MLKKKVMERYEEVIEGLGFDYTFTFPSHNPLKIFDELEAKNIVSGRRPETVIAICIYLSLKRQDRRFMKKDFIKYFDLTDVGFRNNVSNLKKKGLLKTSSDRYRDRAVMRNDETGDSVGVPQEAT